MSSSIPKLETFQIKLHSTGVAEIIFNRPHIYNALSRQVNSEWLEAINWAAACDDVKVAMLIGRGKYYTSGKQLSPSPMPAGATLEERIAINKESSSQTRALVAAMVNFPKLLIAAINGHAIGFGVTTMALCDVIYSVPHATFKTPFMKLGFCAEGCSSVLLPRIMGPSRANEMLLMGREFTAEELEQCGLISRVLPEEGFHEHVLKLATEAAQFSMGALTTTKKLVRDVDREVLLKANDDEFDRLAERVSSPESVEAIRKFVEDNEKKKALKKQKQQATSKL